HGGYIGEQAGEQQVLVLIELVIAQAAGDGPLLRDVPGGFAEHGVLLERVAQVRIERRVRRRIYGRTRHPDDRVVTGSRQVLSVGATNVLEEPALQPLQRRAVAGGDADLLGERIQRRAVVERRIYPHVLLDVGVGIAQDVERHAAGELRGITQHAHLAVRVGGD